MTSSVVSVLFLLVSLVFCVSVVDPAGVKIRITNQALDMLKNQAEAIIQEQLVNQPFPQVTWSGCTIDRLMITQVTIRQASLRFWENSGFHFVMQNFDVRLSFDHRINLCLFEHTGTNQFTAAGVNANMELSLIRNQGRLAVAMPTCEVSTQRMVLTPSGIPGRVLNWVSDHMPTWMQDWLLGCLRHVLDSLFCPLVQRFGLPSVNQKLDTIPMRAEVFPAFGISIDYSLTRDVQVTATSLDMSFQGLVFREGENNPALNPAVDPVFTETRLMAYVGISELVFNSAAVSFYNAGVLGKKFEQIPPRAARALRIRQFFKQPWRLKALNDPLVVGVQLTETPTISISQRQGVTVNLRVRVRAATTPANKEPNAFMSASSTCEVSLMLSIHGSAQGNRLSLPYDNVKCRIVTSNRLKKFLVRPLEGLLNDKAADFLEGWFYEGVEVPLPEGLIFTQGLIQYQEGFVVVGGNLDLTPAGRQKVVRGMGR